MMKVGMEFHIDYAHHLAGHDLCGKPHGHTAKIVVEVMANKDIVYKFRDSKKVDNYKDAMLIDFRDLKKQVNKVIDKLDHNDLNSMFNYPSSEIVANWIWNQLMPVFDHENYNIHSVRFYEGNGKYVEIIADTIDWYAKLD